MTARHALPTGWRRVLSHRSVLDKIAVPRHCELADPADLPVVSAMVREGFLTFMETASLPMYAEWQNGRVLMPISCDIYKITENGVALCEKHGIKQR